MSCLISHLKEQLCNELTRTRSCGQRSTYCECVHAVELELDELVELVIVNEASIAEYHPMHLHGHSFSVLGSDTLGTESARITKSQVIELDRAGSLKRNFDMPTTRDTIAVPKHGYSIIRFVADNPGVWPLHCHIDFHSEMAMMMLFRVGTDSHLPPKPVGWLSCGPQERLKKSSQIVYFSSSSKLILNFYLIGIFYCIIIY
jgi:L-ascorbate oxidase